MVGPSAAGKSTLARVSTGVWPAANGGVRLDGNDISDWSPHELGKHVGYLPQDVELFGGTVMQNIGRFEDQIDSEAVIDAAEQAGCHEVIRIPFRRIQHADRRGRRCAVWRAAPARCSGPRAVWQSAAVVALDEPNSNLDFAARKR